MEILKSNLNEKSAKMDNMSEELTSKIYKYESEIRTLSTRI